MRTRSWATVVLIVGLALGLVFLWPAPDPFAGVETVALATPSGEALRLPQGVLDGLEIALGDRNVRLVTRPDEADAVLAIEPEAAQIFIDERGLRARVRCTLTERRTGERYTLDLYVTLDDRGLNAKLVVRRPWEVWAERLGLELTRP